MRLRWTVVQEAGPGRDTATTAAPSVDVVLDCAVGTTVADVLPLLRDLGGRHHAPDLGPASLPGRGLWVSGSQCELAAPLGTGDLIDGAVVRLGPPASAPGAGRRETSFVPGDVAPHLLDLVVLAGPDSGRRVPLNGRRLSCGRAPGNDVVLADPRLSRHHCDLVVGTDGVAVVDLGSTNGSPIGEPETDEGGTSALVLNGTCELGASVLGLRPAGPVTRTSPSPGRASAEGTRTVHRSPRTRQAERAPDVRLPAPPREPRHPGFPLLAVALPAVAAVALASWTGSAVYLLLAGLGPLLVLGGWFGSRRESRRDGVLSRREHARLDHAARLAARQAAAELASDRGRAMPDAATLLSWCTRSSGRLWEREPGDPDAVRVRLGRAALAGAGQERASPALLPRVHLVDADGRSEPVTSPADLVSVDLRDGALGVVETDDTTSLSRLVVGQLLVLLPPGRLTVSRVVSGPARERWRWLWLVPHDAAATAEGGAAEAARAVAELVRTRLDRSASAAARAPSHDPVLVVVDDPAGELSAADLTWLAEAHRVGVHTVCSARATELLPHGCATLVEPDSADGVQLRVTRSEDGSSALVVGDRVGAWWAERLARGLAPLRCAEDGDSSMPARVELSDLVELSAEAVAARWRTPAGGLAVPVGQGSEGTVVLDLVATGPHALVAGTTGSGKSELLRTWLLALAACHPPSRVTFLLVDYKGGATFDELSALPHTVGLLTDLDGGSTVRVLASLRAEVRRRERLLATAGARDLHSYLAMDVARDQGLPRLLVVVDEFRVLAEDAPDVLGEFVRLAATGRSLGIHLVLATQRPSGVVSADIRANASLRIGLRMQDPAESRDVLDRPDAASLDPGSPGRAVVVGPGVDGVVQTAWSGSHRSLAGPRLTVVHPAPPAVGASPVTAANGGDPGSSVKGLVDTVRRAAGLVGEPTARPPWLPALPSELSRPRGAAGSPGTNAPRGADWPEPSRQDHDLLVLGMTDLPWRQARGTLAWHPTRDGPALVLGGPRSGRSTTLRTAAVVAGGKGVPVLHLGCGHDEDHLVDVLTALASAPVPSPSPGPDDSGPADAGPADPEPGGLPGSPSEPGTAPPMQLLLVLDDVDLLLDPAADPQAADELARLLRTGHRAGIGVLLAGGRALGGSRLASAARVRLVHRTTDPTDALVAGVPARAPRPQVPGRCVVMGLSERSTDADGHEAVEAQVFLTGREVEPVPVELPEWVPRRLPTGAEIRGLSGPTGPTGPSGFTGPTGFAGPGAAPVGMVVRGTRATPWVPDLSRAGLMAVVGPAGSGRSEALRAMAAYARASGIEVAEGAETDASHPVDLLVLDDVDRLDAGWSTALEAWAEGRGGPVADVLAPGGSLLVAGSTDSFADCFRGLPALLRRTGHGIVLQPGRTDVRDVLGVRDAPRQRVRAVGRGVLVERGRAARLQLCAPGPPPGAAGSS